MTLSSYNGLGDCEGQGDRGVGKWKSRLEFKYINVVDSNVIRKTEDNRL